MGSSRSRTSTRVSRIAARASRAACPPDSVVVGWSSTALAEPEVLADLGDPGVEVGRADRHPALQGGVVAARRVGRARGDRRGGRLELGRRLGHAGAAGQQRPTGLAGAALRLLREQGDGRGRWGDRHRAGVGSQPAGEHGQERRLADPVRAHDAQAGAGADGQVDAAEHGGAGTVDDQVARDDGDGGGRRQGTPFGRAPARAGSDGQGLCSLHGAHATGRGAGPPGDSDRRSRPHGPRSCRSGRDRISPHGGSVPAVRRGSRDSAYQSSSGREPGPYQRMSTTPSSSKSPVTGTDARADVVALAQLEPPAARRIPR